MQLAALRRRRRRGGADRLPARHLPGLSAGPHRRSSTTASTRRTCGRIRRPRSRSATTGRASTRDTPVVTYVTRNIEPMRGSHIVIRSLPDLLGLDPRPAGRVHRRERRQLFGPPPDGQDLARHLPRQVETPGRLVARPFRRARALQLSSCECCRSRRRHLYLTYPFVLSWSLIESMALECRIVASATRAGREVITDGENGRLFPFFDRRPSSRRVRETLDDRGLGRHGREARPEGGRGIRFPHRLPAAMAGASSACPDQGLKPAVLDFCAVRKRRAIKVSAKLDLRLRRPAACVKRARKNQCGTRT